MVQELSHFTRFLWPSLADVDLWPSDLVSSMSCKTCWWIPPFIQETWRWKTDSQTDRQTHSRTTRLLMPPACIGSEGIRIKITDCTCRLADICSLPEDSGPCRGYFVRWYYNTTTGRCQEFVYGGCEGNENRFETEVECRTTCKAEPPQGMLLEILTWPHNFLRVYRSDSWSLWLFFDFLCSSVFCFSFLFSLILFKFWPCAID